ncbi:hypothetical protein HPP92_011185 [Vanilla planifolia]|uniref:Nucleotide-diphospho-sugar transferase domain-containing protein n=1 Tax=Vanilla planifolia TaxID=51239 RepID=A0A835R6L6_VANPL|nr:hypothetical protein HPP92_011185 [Vanilla planifolia]
MSAIDLKFCTVNRITLLATITLLVFAATLACLWAPINITLFPSFNSFPSPQETSFQDDLEVALKGAAMRNKTLIISILNKAYMEENGMLDLFLRSFREGDGTDFLTRHLLLVAVDEEAFQHCRRLKHPHCFRFVGNETDLSGEVVYMSVGFIDMMWKRTQFLGEVLRRGYNFIFTDMDVVWLRNPFAKLQGNGEDMLLSCDKYNGRADDESNSLNTGFYFVAANNKTVALFDEWYAARNKSRGMKEQDVLSSLKNGGIFKRLGMRVRFLDTLYFSGFCEDSRDLRQVSTVHANCCRTAKAKLADLRAVLETWKAFHGYKMSGWPKHRVCSASWKTS